MQKFIIKINSQTADLGAYPEAECFVLAEDLPEEYIKNFSEKVRPSGKIILTTNPDICLKYNLDGVLLDFSKSENITKDYQAQTQRLKGKFIGAICRNRRHEAMIVSECEPDFIVFRAWKDGLEKVLELTDWYNEFFLIQSAVLPMESDLNTSAFKTDFVIVNL